MKALILNSGLGHRMGVLTSEHPKCMTEVSPTDTILSRQLKLLAENGIEEVVMTTGYFDEVLVNYCKSLFENIKGVLRVIERKTLSYAETLRSLKPAYVVHGDDWRDGIQKAIRSEVTDVLAEYGGILVECPYTQDEKYKNLEKYICLSK